MDIEGELDKVPEAKGIKMIISGLRFAAKDDSEVVNLGLKI